MKLCPVGAEMFLADGSTDRQTDMIKPTAAFRNFAKTPKKGERIHLLSNFLGFLQKGELT
jgi:hypothetical protein